MTSARAKRVAGRRFGGSFAEGIRAGSPVALGSLLLALSFGVSALPVIGAFAAISMSVIVFAGASQFAAITVLAAGGGPITAILAAILVNLRFVPMGIALAPSFTHRRLGRAVRAQAIMDASWAMAYRDGGGYDLRFMYGATVAQYVGWVLGTVLGVLLGGAVGDPRSLGLDVIFPAFFLALLASEMGRPHARTVAALGAMIALVLTPLAPAGIPIVAASVAIVVGLRA